MNGQPLTQRLPAGLMDKGVEFYFHQGEIWCLTGGQPVPFNRIPPAILNIVDEDMAKHPDAVRALLAWDLHTREEMLRQYILCRFGGFDLEPDITAEGVIEHTEYFDCGKRGTCSMEGKLCPAIKVENGYLTKKELEVVKYTGQGKANCEIAALMHISEETVKSHMQNIQQKCGFSSKLEVTAFAIKKNLL